MAHYNPTYCPIEPNPRPLANAATMLLLTSGLITYYLFDSVALLTLGLIFLLRTIYLWRAILLTLLLTCIFPNHPLHELFFSTSCLLFWLE